MLARSEATSFDFISMTMFDPFKAIIELSSPIGRVARSGERASQIAHAMRSDFAEMVTLAAQFVEVNVVRARCNLEVALWTVPYSRCNPGESR